MKSAGVFFSRIEPTRKAVSVSGPHYLDVVVGMHNTACVGFELDVAGDVVVVGYGAVVSSGVGLEGLRCVGIGVIEEGGEGRVEGGEKREVDEEYVDGHGRRVAVARCGESSGCRYILKGGAEVREPQCSRYLCMVR